MTTFIMIIISFQYLALPSGEFQVRVQLKREHFGNLGMQKRDTHFTIIYISSAWQGEVKISKDVTHTSPLYIYRQLGRGNSK